MKTKKRAIRRVTNVPSLESIDLYGLAEREEHILDLRSETIISAVGSVDVNLDSVSKRLCKDRPASSQASIGSGPIQQPNTENRKEGCTFNVDSQCHYTPTGFSEQPFESMLHVPNGEPSHHSDKDFEYHTNAGPPVQIRDECDVQQSQATGSSTLNGATSFVDKGKQKMCDLSNEHRFVSERPHSTSSEINDAEFLCDKDIFMADANRSRIISECVKRAFTSKAAGPSSNETLPTGAPLPQACNVNVQTNGQQRQHQVTMCSSSNNTRTPHNRTRRARQGVLPLSVAAGPSSNETLPTGAPLPQPCNVNVQTNSQQRQRQVTMRSSSNNTRTPHNRTRRARQGPPTTYMHMGRCDQICRHCGARFWYDERLASSTRARIDYHKCCNGGKVRLDTQDEYPQYIKDLFTNRHFMENIRAYNQMFAMTSLGAEIDNSINMGRGPYVFKISGQLYHRMGSLCPETNMRPQFLQLYIYDTENEVANRLEHFQRSGQRLRPDVVENLIELLDEHNELVQLFRTVRDKMAEADIPEFKVRLFGVVGSRQHELPTGDSIGAIVFEGGPDVETEFDVVVQQHDRQLQHVSKLNASYMSMQFPLVFFFGEDGYHLGRVLLTRRTSADPPKKMTMKMYYAYELHDRFNENRLLPRSGRLFQQYVVTAYCSIEQSRIDFIREHQGDIRNDYMAGLHDAISRGDTNGSDVGSRTILPSSFTGGPRYMYSHYLDALAICRVHGNPSFFITFTCNVNWPEIQEYMEQFPHVTVADRPDVVDRVFERKIHQLLTFLRDSRPFGHVEAVLYTVEFQKRGLPHCHLLLWVRESDRVQAHTDVNRYVSAELPDPATDPEGYRVITEFMMHGPCGLVNTSAPCMQDSDVCTKKFPKAFCPETFIDKKGCVHYRRRDSGITTMRQDVSLDNGYVVPHSRSICMRFYAHINVEYCEWSMLIKYLFKYISKGTDRIVTHITRTLGSTGASTSRRSLHIDEIKNFQDARFISPHEACWRILGFNIHSRDPPVQILAVHLENMQRVNFRRHQQLQTVVDSEYNKRTTLTEWFKYNLYNTDGRHLTHLNFPKEYVWYKDGKYWQRRRRASTLAIGRLVYVHPNSGDAFYLRLLLCHQKGLMSFRHIRTVDEVVCPTNRAACEAMGLLGGDQEWNIALQEASFSATPSYMRNLFCQILIFCEVSSPVTLLQSHADSMSEDIPQILSEVLHIQDLHVTPEDLHDGLMYELQAILTSYGKSVKDFGFNLPPPHLLQVLNNRALMEERSYNRELLRSESERLVGRLNADQRIIFEQVTHAVNGRYQNLIFVYGHGGTGKTFVWRTIISTLRSEGKIVLAVTSSGIAALLLLSGQTAHSRFKIPLDLSDESMCSVKKKTQVAELLRQTDLIVWDEAPMNDRRCFETLDRTLKDIMDKPTDLFGGKMVILGGDFRQTLPVKKKATKKQIISSCITQSYLWPYFKIIKLKQNMRLQQPGLSPQQTEEISTFSQWLLEVGNGTIGQPDEADPENSSWVQIPDRYCIPESSTTVQELINFIYDEQTLQAPDATSLQGKAIVCPRNETADTINSTILNMLEGDTYTFISVDEAIPKSNDGGATELLYPQEYLNTLSFSGMPPPRTYA